MPTPRPLKFLLCLAGLILLASGASAQIWIGLGADSNWDTPENWDTGAPPPNGATATFNSFTTKDPIFSANGFNGTQLGSIVFNAGSDAEVFTGGVLSLSAPLGLDNQSVETQTFDNTGVTVMAAQSWNAGSGSFAFSGLVALRDNLTLTGGSNFTFSGALVNSGGNQSLINNATGIVTLGNVSLSNNGSSQILTLSGTGNTAVTGTIINGGGSSGITKTGTGSLTLSGTNTYTGVTTINAGTVSVATIGAAGVASNLGAATNATTSLVLGGGTLAYTGATASTDRNFTLTTGTTSTISVTNAGSNLTVSGVSTNTNGALTKAGAGTLTLSGANLYTGTTTVTAGTLAYGVNNALSSGAVNVNGGTLALGTFADNVGAVTLTSGSITGSTGVLTGTSYNVQSGSISAILGGSGALTKSTAGTVTLSGNNTYTGNTSIDTGVLNIGSNRALGGTANGTTVAAGAALQLQGGITVTGEGLTLIGSGIAGDGALRNISGNNTWTGTVTLLGGNPFLQSDSGLLTLSGTLTGSNQSITVGGAGDTLLSGLNDTGSGTLTKNGTGTLTLTGTASRSTDGGTQVNDGTLALSMGAGVNALGTGSPVNATTIGNNVGAASSATLSLLANSQISDSTPVTINSDGRFALNVFSETIDSLEGTGVVDLGASGSLTVGANNSSFLFGGTIVGSGNLTKIGSGTFTLTGTNTYTGVTTINAGTVSVATIGNAGVASNLGAATNATTSLVLGGGTLAYTGATASTNRNFALTGGTISTINVIGTTNLTMSGVAANGGVGNGALTKTGAGTLTLSGANTYTGATTINAGALTVGSSGALGGIAGGTSVANGAALQLQGGITVAGESLSLTGSGIALDGALRNISGNNTWSGNVTLFGNPFFQSDSGLLTVSGNLSGSNQSITVGGAGDVLLSGGNSTGAGTLTKNGTGTLTLSGSASRNTEGDTHLNDGTLQLNMAAGVNALGPGAYVTVIGDNIGAAGSATLSLLASDQIADSTPVTINSDGRFSLNFFSETISTLTGSGQVDLGSIGSLTVGASDGTSSFGGTIVGSGSLTKTGAGTFTLVGNNTYTGATTVSGGILNIQSVTALGAPGTGTTVASGATLQMLAGLTFAGEDLTLNGLGVSGVGALRSISGSNTWTGNITVNSNSSIANDAGTLTLTGNITDNGGGQKLTVDTDGSTLISGSIDGTTILDKAGSGTLTLTGTNTYTGLTTIRVGAVNLQNGSALGAMSGTTTVSDLAALQLQNNITVTGETLNLAGTGQSSTGALRNLSGNNIWTGDIFLNANSSIGSEAGGLLTIWGNIINSGSNRGLTVTGAGDTLISGGINTSTGELFKQGSGTLTLTGTSTFTGKTFVNVGVLNIEANNALGSTLSDTTVATGAALQLQSVTGISVAGHLTLTGTGIGSTGALRNISGDNTWAGPVTLEGNNTLIQSDDGLLTISGALTGTDESVTVGGAGDTLLSGLNDTGSGTLTKNGTGTLTLAGSASRSTDGGTQVNDGTLELNMTAGVNALGVGDLLNATIIGNGDAISATLSLLANSQISDSTPVTINSDGRLVLNNFSETIGSLTGIGLVDLGTSGALTVGASNGTSTFDGTIVGSGSLAKTGSGTFTLTGNNTYTGATTVSGGILNIQSVTALGAASAGTTVASGATLQVQGGLTVAEGLTLNGIGVAGAGALESLSGNNTWAGNITLASDSTVEIDAGALTLAGNITDNGGNRKLLVDAKSSTEISGSIGGTTALDKEGSSTLRLTGANTFTGATTIRVGAVNIQNGSALGSGAGQTTVSNLAALQLENNITVTGETLDLAGTGQGGTGALRNISGSNTWAGDIIISANSSIASDAGGLLTISGNIINNGFNRALTVTGAGNTVISGGINTDTGELFKQGSGTLTLTGTGTFTGSTFVDAGVLNIEANNALGSTLSGTTVTTGAALQLQSVTGISVAGHLTLNGTGIANDGALRNISGDNTWAGPVTLVGNNTLIQSDSGLLTISGALTGSNQSVTVGGAGNTLLSGTNDTGSGTLTKNGTGTLRLTGSATRSTDGGTQVNDGTLELNMTPGVNALGVGDLLNTTIIGNNIGAAGSATLSILSSNQISDSTPVTINSDGRLMLNNFSETIDSISGTGVVDLGASGVLTVGANNGSSFFGGSIIGTGQLIKEGTGSLALLSSIVLAGELQLKAGTLALSGYNLTADTLRISGNSVIDFAGGNSSLNLTNLIIDAGVTLTVLNWADAADYFYTQGWTGAVFDTGGTAPMNQVVFSGSSGNDTQWRSYDLQVTPVPEPSTYGLLMLLGTGGFAAWRRRRRRA